MFFPLYPILGILTPLIGFIIVAFLGWLFGIGIGVFAGLLFGLFESYFLYQLGLITILVGVLGVFFELGIGWLSGWVGNLQYTTKKQEKRLEKEKRALENEINKRKQAEEKHLNLEKQLRQSQKMEAIGTLAGGIAHDFNNILSIILGYTEMLLDSNSDRSKEKIYLELIYKAGERAADLVRQILTFSRVESPELKPLRIDSFLKEVLKMIRATFPTNIEIRQNIDKDFPPVMANATQIHQVIVNLCSNAAHAIKENGGILEIRLEEMSYKAGQNLSLNLDEGQYVKLTIKDNGSGITSDVKEKIFDPYFTTKAVGEGTGLGLSVVYGIIKDHKGLINVDSVPGVGTSFDLFLPVAATSQYEEKVEEPFSKCGKEHILIVEDETDLAKYYETSLVKHGYNVTVTGNGYDALETFRAHPDQFDLVFTDQTMPKLTGVQLSEELLGIRSNIPIILATGHIDAVSKQDINSIGIRYFLRKPVKIGSLINLIQKMF